MNKHLLKFIAAFILILLLQDGLKAQAPNLGTTANYVLFTSVGAITNTGNSHFTGNIGSNSGSTTGFGNVNGQMHSSDGSTLQAKADLQNLYTQLNTAIPTYAHAPALGNGDTMVAGVISVSGNSTLSNNLYLDAKGNGNAVFIFKLDAPLSTTSAAHVFLINGAQACNVFWKVEGLITIATATIMKGTLVANNAAININSNANLEGRALSTAGAISVNAVTGYTPVGCGSPTLTGPAAPALGTTACYALFSGNGALSNAGVTHVKGDVGTNVGLTTGFNPLLVNGTVHPIPDGSTAACAADLLNVYNYLNTLPADIELLYPAQFGNSLVLTPHTYIMKAGTTFTDTLFLDAQGYADGVFVIQINGAMSTSTHSQVILLNGAQAKNVYWKVDGAVGIHDYSYFKGTLIVNNAAIDITTGVDFVGRALTTNGAFSTASIYISEPGGCITLPVSWIYFQGKPVDHNVLLEWATTDELNNALFTIERSTDGASFSSIATVKGTGGKGKITYNYAYTDKSPNKVNYYRISQTDVDGHTSYYKTIQVKSDRDQALSVIQYTEGNYIYAKVSGATAGIGKMELYSMDGRKISTQQVNLTTDVSTFKINKPVQKGVYLLHMDSNGVQLYNGKVVVN